MWLMRYRPKKNAFLWTLTVIYISKMASYEVGVIL